MKQKLKIGIDPGRNTGFAVYDPEKKSLNLFTYKLHQAFAEIVKMNLSFELEIVIENPNLWTYFGNDKNAKARLQGAGSIKRDYSAWIDFLEDLNVPYRAVRPDKFRNSYAYQPELFSRITGYTKRCSEHARVAAMLVWRC